MQMTYSLEIELKLVEILKQRAICMMHKDSVYAECYVWFQFEGSCLRETGLKMDGGKVSDV